MDQPNAYKIDISENLKSRLWMTPLFQDYALPFDDLMNISNLYNNWLKDEVLRNNINFVPLSSKIPPNLNIFLMMFILLKKVQLWYPNYYSNI